MIELKDYQSKAVKSLKGKVQNLLKSSGTTNIACLNTNRQCIGMEKDEKYFKIATKRLEEAKGQSRPF